MDVESRSRWERYTKAKEAMLERTHIAEAPWWVVEADDKKRARLNCLSHLLSQMPYQEIRTGSFAAQGTQSKLPSRPDPKGNVCASAILRQPMHAFPRRRVTLSGHA
jgi:Polyphosphate kinase 2 (PPK2)